MKNHSNTILFLENIHSSTSIIILYIDVEYNDINTQIDMNFNRIQSFEFNRLHFN